MQYLEAPTVFDGTGPSLFMAGGISGCVDWQRQLADLLKTADLDLAVINPRRGGDYPFDDPHAARVQIEWEHQHLRRASMISFWFPPETLCPIALYELGAWSMTDKPLFVGVHPDYRRRPDIVIQTSLVRPAIKVVSTIDELAAQIALASI